MDKITVDTREQALYSGPDRSGTMPKPPDWNDLFENLAPLVASQLKFARWAVEQTMTPSDFEAAKKTIISAMEKPRSGGE